MPPRPILVGVCIFAGFSATIAAVAAVMVIVTQGPANDSANESAPRNPTDQSPTRGPASCFMECKRFPNESAANSYCDQVENTCNQNYNSYSCDTLQQECIISGGEASLQNVTQVTIRKLCLENSILQCANEVNTMFSGRRRLQEKDILVLEQKLELYADDGRTQIDEFQIDTQKDKTIDKAIAKALSVVDVSKFGIETTYALPSGTDVSSASSDALINVTHETLVSDFSNFEVIYKEKMTDERKTKLPIKAYMIELRECKLNAQSRALAFYNLEENDAFVDDPDGLGFCIVSSAWTLFISPKNLYENACGETGTETESSDESLELVKPKSEEENEELLFSSFQRLYKDSDSNQNLGGRLGVIVDGCQYQFDSEWIREMQSYRKGCLANHAILGNDFEKLAGAQCLVKQTSLTDIPRGSVKISATSYDSYYDTYYSDNEFTIYELMIYRNDKCTGFSQLHAYHTETTCLDAENLGIERRYFAYISLPSLSVRAYQQCPPGSNWQSDDNALWTFLVTNDTCYTIEEIESQVGRRLESRQLETTTIEDDYYTACRCLDLSMSVQSMPTSEWRIAVRDRRSFFEQTVAANVSDGDISDISNITVAYKVGDIFESINYLLYFSAAFDLTNFENYLQNVVFQEEDTGRSRSVTTIEGSSDAYVMSRTFTNETAAHDQWTVIARLQVETP